VGAWSGTFERPKDWRRNGFHACSAFECAAQHLADCAMIEGEAWRAQVTHYLPLIEHLISQAERRVLAGETMPAGDKLVSLFDTHADIIVKVGHDVHYGHKLNLATGRSGLILDLVVEV
jgi:IS5 family transposase